ncbi:Transcription factor bye1 [Coniothyrium glycines]
MAEETRRSGRANKGQHTKNLDGVDESSPAPVKPKPQPRADKKAPGKGQAKGNNVRAQSTQSVEAEEEEEEEEEDAVIRCVCGDQRDIRGRQMICCDSCEAWQHNKCLGLPEGDYWENKQYYCEQCKPENHVELLAAMERGEKPWARKKGSKPKPRPSDVKQETAPQVSTPRASETPSQSAPAAVAVTTTITTEASTPTPAVASVETQDATNGNGHAHAHAHAHAEPQDPKSQPQSPVGEKRRHEPTDKASASKKRRKSSHPETKASAPAAPPADIEALPQNQKALAEKLADILAPLIKKASDERGYRIPDGETPKSLATRHTLHISHAALQHLGEPTGSESPYFARLRSIMFNVKKNAVLVDRLLSGNLKADEFVTMEAEEMASADKQREFAAMREAAERQMILTDEPGPRLRKTHKGEEIIGEDTLADQDFKQPPLPEREHIAEVAVMQSPVGARPPESPTGPPPIDTSALPDSARRASANFDINSVFNKVRSPQHDQQTFLRRQNSAQTTEKPQAPVDDADVDRLLKDEDNDVEMSGYSTDPTVCWQGSIQMQSMEPFDAVARFVAGGDFSLIISWEKLLTNSLSVQGRIESAKGNDYIQGIAHTESHEVAILSVSPVTTEGRAVQDHLYNYFHSRGRWGVVPVNASGDDVLRDLYVIPIAAGGSNLPPFIDMLEHCTIETPRKEAMLLLALIAKLPEVKPPGPLFEAQQPQLNPSRPAPFPPQSSSTNGPSPSPVTNPHGPQYSPVGASFPAQTPYGNPYAQPPPQAPQLLVPHPNAPPHHHIPRALEILGPYIDAPVIVTILSGNLSQNAAVSELQMANLRHICETMPEARDNIQVLTEHLRQKSEATANGQAQG